MGKSNLFFFIDLNLKEAYGLKLRFLMSKLKLFYRQTNYLEDLINTSRYNIIYKGVYINEKFKAK